MGKGRSNSGERKIPCGGKKHKRKKGGLKKEDANREKRFLSLHNLQRQMILHQEHLGKTGVGGGYDGLVKEGFNQERTQNQRGWSTSP